MNFQESLRLPRRLETTQAALALPRRLMRVFCPVIEVTTLAMNDSRQNHSFRRSIAAELVGDDHTRRPFGGAQELAKEQDRGPSVPFRLHQNINDGAVLVDRSPQRMLHSVALPKDFVEMPFVTELRSPSFQLGGVRRTEFIAPVPDRFVRE